jgi:hypothetical protein
LDTRRCLVAKRDIVAEIAAAVPRNQHGLKPWHERVPAEHRELLRAIHAAWHAGEFGSKKITAARTISAKLSQLGISIGEQGVMNWLDLPQKS